MNASKSFQQVLILLFTFTSMGLLGCKEASKESHLETVVDASKAHAPNKPLAWKDIKKVSIIILENTDFEVAFAQPFLKQLSQKGALLTQYYAITHPSQPNYIALVAGSQSGVESNKSVTLNVTHLGDLVERAGLNWKVYAEGFPGNCFLGATRGSYARRHVPFLSFENIQSNTSRCQRIVSESEFKKDLQSQSLPHFSLYIPNNDNNGHDTGVAYADRWLSQFLSPLLDGSNDLSDTLFVVTFDEGSMSGNNRVTTFLLGSGVKAGAISSRKYDHYSLLRTVEEILNLPTLEQNDKSAQIIQDVWLK